jgi:hypothetical protein
MYLFKYNLTLLTAIVDSRKISHNTVLKKNSYIVCLNSKFPPHVELCWQNKNISKLGILITKVGNIIIFLYTILLLGFISTKCLIDMIPITD